MSWHPVDVVWRLLRPLLFRLDAETAHHGTLRLLAAAPGLWGRLARLARGHATPAPRRLGGLTLSGPVGLAAGLDKDGVAIPFWPALGFGFVEVGTVTAWPQPGNPRPRLFRLPADRALINRMGFNNAGSAALAVRLRELRDKGRWPAEPAVVNLGKSKVTPVAEAVGDYVTSLHRLRGLADYFVINVSSPNTPGLRSLQERPALARLLPAAREAAGETPLLLKLAPDLDAEALAEAVELSLETGLAGIVATNTTLRREGLEQDPGEAGGLSGAPLWPIARQAIASVLAAAAGRIPVIGVGGISTGAQAAELLRAGCTAVQVYSALIYEGPGLPARLARELARMGVV